MCLLIPNKKMKKNYSLLLLFAVTLSFAQTFYSENFGTPTVNSLFPAYTSGTAPATFQNSGTITYTGNGDVRSSAASSGYTGASGGGNVFLTSTAGKFIQINGLNSSSYLQSDLQLSFGHSTSNTTLAQLAVEVSINGSTWTALTFPQNPTTAWNLITIGGGQIPSSSTLSIRFTQPATAQMRIDDVKLASVSASCTLALGTPVVTCNTSTLALDNYTVTIPYTGAGNATYVITPNFGTVGGDNPTTVAAGNIIISGITEGTAYSINVLGGTCNFTLNGNSPDCKPINTLPFNEPFNYTATSSLGSQQSWSNLNSGDNIIIEANNLSYGTLTGTGNLAGFSGDGLEAFTPFTQTILGTIYAGFMFSITDYTNVTTDGTATYFATLTDAAKNFKARLFIKKVASQYQIGFDSASTTTNYDLSLRNVGDVVYVILGYDFANNTVLNAWINPNLATFSSTTPPTLTATTTAIADLGGFVLRQDGLTSTPSIKVDELKISNVATDFTLSASTFTQINGLKMYPNTAKNNLYIETTNNSDIKVTITNMLGKEVLTTKVINNSINISNLTTGIYIVKITEEGKTVTRKLIIN